MAAASSSSQSTHFVHHRASEYPHSLHSAAPTQSSLNLNSSSLPPVILTRADLRESVDTFNALLASAKNYRCCLMALSTATSSFAKCLEDCARLKGARTSPPLPGHHQGQNCSHPLSNDPSRNGSIYTNFHHNSDEMDKLSPAEKLLAASGLHFMTANLEQVLSATFHKSFEIPLLDVCDAYRRQLADRQGTYEADISHRTQVIRETELKNLGSGFVRRSGKSGRDLESFRRGLKELQDQVESVEKLKYDYYLEVASGERDIWKTVAESMSLVIKSEVEVYDRIASKATSDPTLESMVSCIPDPFDAYKPLASGNASSSQQPEIYSILPPLTSILTPAAHITRKPLEQPEQPSLPSPSDPLGTSVIPDHPHLNSTSHWVRSPFGSPPASSSFDIDRCPQPHLDPVDHYTPYDRPQSRSHSLFDSPPTSKIDTRSSNQATIRAREWLQRHASLNNSDAIAPDLPVENVSLRDSASQALSDGSSVTVGPKQLIKSSSSPTLASVPESAHTIVLHLDSVDQTRSGRLENEVNHFQDSQVSANPLSERQSEELYTPSPHELTQEEDLSKVSPAPRLSISYAEGDVAVHGLPLMADATRRGSYSLSVSSLNGMKRASGEEDESLLGQGPPSGLDSDSEG